MKPAVHEYEAKFDWDSKQFPLLSCIIDTWLFSVLCLGVTSQVWIQWCGGESPARGNASIWLASFHDDQAEPHLSIPISVKQQEDDCMATEKRETPLTSLSVSPSILTLSACSITPSFGNRQRSKTVKDERKTELSSDSSTSIRTDSINRKTSVCAHFSNGTHTHWIRHTLKKCLWNKKH